MKSKKGIRQVLEEAFEVLKKGAITEKVIRWKNFNVIEIEISSIIIGVGMNDDHSIMKIFMIKNDCHYESYDPRKYKPTFTLGIPENCGRNEYWAFRLEDEHLHSNSGSIHEITTHVQVTSEVLKLLPLISYQ